MVYFVASDFELASIVNKAVRLASCAGKILIINFHQRRCDRANGAA